MKTTGVLLAVALVVTTLVGANQATADAELNLSVGDPNIMPIAIGGTIGNPDIRDLDIMIGDPGIAPVLSLNPVEGLEIRVVPPSPIHR